MLEKCVACKKKCGNKIPKHVYYPVEGNIDFHFILCDKCYQLTNQGTVNNYKRLVSNNGNKKRRELAKEFYSVVYPLILKMKEEGKTLPFITNELNTLGHRTRKGKLWSVTQVLRVLNICNTENLSLTTASNLLA